MVKITILMANMKMVFSYYIVKRSTIFVAGKTHFFYGPCSIAGYGGLRLSPPATLGPGSPFWTSRAADPHDDKDR